MTGAQILIMFIGVVVIGYVMADAIRYGTGTKKAARAARRKRLAPNPATLPDEMLAASDIRDSWHNQHMNYPGSKAGPPS